MRSCIFLATTLQCNIIIFNYSCPDEETEVPKIRRAFPSLHNELVVSEGAILGLRTQNFH